LRRIAVGATTLAHAAKDGALMMVHKRMKSFSALALAGLMASGCQAFSTERNVGPCPPVGALYAASRIVEIKGDESFENVGFTGEIAKIDSFCRYVDDNPIDMTLNIDFSLGRGPAAQEERRTYRYFVAVTRRDVAVIAKEFFEVDVRFPGNATVVTVRDQIGGIIIPRANKEISGANFEILVGFELTPEQLAFNTDGKRFRLRYED